AKSNMAIADHTVVVSNEDAATIDKTAQQKFANENVYDYAPDYAVEDDISVRAVSSADGEAKYIPQSSNKSNSSNNSENSSKIQLAIVWLVPNVITYLGVILFATTMFTPLLIVIAIGVLGSVVGAYIIGNCITGLFKIKPPQKAILNLKVGNSKLKAAMSRKASSDTAMQTRRLTIMLLTVIWLVPVAVAGWLLFILYCNKKFMGKLLTMAQDCDSADSIVATRQGALYDIAYYFYRMIDYAFVYIDINERKSAKEMIDRAENLLDVWTILYPDL
ncbi:MAG: hypothetical protein K2L54_05255, partial [Clostridiales bacterium]|nr:hypothetical protein [Clostridiales bacterium]